VRVIELEGVTVAPNGGPPRLCGVDWTVAEGEHWAVLGANGAGKTTLLDAVAGRAPVTAGRVAVLGREVGSPRMRDPRRHLGLLGTGRATFAGAMTPVDVALNRVGISAAEQGRREAPEERERALVLLAQLGCDALLERRFGDLSHGERQRVLIARALMRRPPVLTLDEPAVGLDIGGRETLLDALATVAREQPGLTTVTVTHHIEELPASTTHALLLRAGEVVAAGDAGSTLTGEALTRCFGLPLTVERARGRWFAQLG
jgi:iron complex transport system ATP-binding protein